MARIYSVNSIAKMIVLIWSGLGICAVLVYWFWGVGWPLVLDVFLLNLGMLVLFFFRKTLSSRFNDRYQFIVERAPMGIYQRDLFAGTYHYVNLATVKQFDCQTVQEFLSSYNQLSHRWARPERHEEFKRLMLEKREVLGFEVEVVLKDGRTKWFSLYGFLSQDDRTINGFSIDMTQEKLAMLELEHHRQHLEELVDHRTAELKIAVQESQAANRAKSTFLANMSHEIRTPMNAIVGLCHLCLDLARDSKERDFLAKISQASKSLLGVINDILDFSKIEAGKLDLEKIPFDLNLVISGVADLVGPQIDAKGLEFILDMPSTPLPMLMGDGLRMGQILTNLMGNAAKFTSRGYISLRVDVQREWDEGIRLKFAICDTGIGISATNQNKLFTSFSQADGSTSRKFGGTGLGLAISRQLCRMMGGEIIVHSIVDQGSEFCFELEWDKAPSRSIQNWIPPSLADKKVLIVDDNPLSLQILQKYLQALEMECQVQSSSRCALELFAHNPGAFDLVLIDWKMPLMDGLELAAQMRACQGAACPKLVLISAFSFGAQVRELEGLFDAYLLKPILPHVLSEKLLKLFGRIPDFPAQSLISNRRFSGQRVLLVEDNEINILVAREILLNAGLVVGVARDGPEGIQMVKSETWDLVLMDVQMPEMDGFEATRRIRNLGSPWTELPILAMTANAMDQDVRKSVEAGMNGHLSKPIEPVILLQILSKWLMDQD